ncbi:hypothetical protein C6497_00105 [Candidatus Poribacteria bacterium]|nr:MAG: hypothetical protein C6497_00105 [Candidatus Poribacteria bacterium]
MRTIVELTIRFIHLTSASVWFGGVVFTTLITIPVVRKNLITQDLLKIHNRFRGVISLMIHILYITGAIVVFMVAWNNDMKLNAEYMIFSACKLGAFGLMALFWGLYSSLYRKHLEVAPPNNVINIPAHIILLGHLTLFSGLIVIVLALLLRI